MLATCTPAQLTHSKEEEVCWSLGGELGFEIGVELLVELGVSGGLNSQLSGCRTLGESFTFFTQVSNCFTTFTRQTWVESRVHGTITETPRSWHWYKYPSSGQGQPVSMGWTQCGGSSGNGTAWLTTARGVQHAPYPEECGAPEQPIPDPFDGQRALPCCAPLPPCDQIPQGMSPCCGCYGGG
ncbi:MAG: hypothetical protein AB7K52_07415 [Phycisphaerales bacterium]